MQKGHMLGVMGASGSGKTSLLMSVLGEIPRVEGYIRTAGKFAFVSQDPWLYRGTIRDNILFGTAMNRQKYNKAIVSCDLTNDLENLTDGDMTSVGDQNVSLTNVQQAKISLARAIYQDADTYLLDDILTNMDHKTALQVRTEALKDGKLFFWDLGFFCILGFWDFHVVVIWDF